MMSRRALMGDTGDTGLIGAAHTGKGRGTVTPAQQMFPYLSESHGLDIDFGSGSQTMDLIRCCSSCHQIGPLEYIGDTARTGTGDTARTGTGDTARMGLCERVRIGPGR